MRELWGVRRVSTDLSFLPFLFVESNEIETMSTVMLCAVSVLTLPANNYGDATDNRVLQSGNPRRMSHTRQLWTIVACGYLKKLRNYVDENQFWRLAAANDVFVRFF